MGDSTGMRPDSLEQFRAYLALLARAQFDDRFQGKFDPSDVVQQTLTEAYEHREQFCGQTHEELGGWLRQILAHNLADAMRRFRTEKRDVDRERSLDAAVDHSSMRLAAWLTSGQSSPSQKVMRHERAMEVADALDQLPEAQREAVVLRHWQGRSLAGISDEMNRTPAAVAGLLKRGLRQLREILDGDE